MNNVSREHQTATRNLFLSGFHCTPFLLVQDRAAMGQPTARRIISFVQPAQQMYFLGSWMEIAKLSPPRSWPASAHEGHRVTTFLPTFRTLPTCSIIRNS